MPAANLTDKFCREVPLPEKGAVFYFDQHRDAPPGFSLRVTRGGAKSWVLTYYVSGIQRRMTLPAGYPDWGPARARSEAAKLRVQVLAGADPLADRDAAREAAAARKEKTARTLGAVLEAYVEHLELAGRVTARQVRAELENHVKEAHPRLWQKPVGELAPEDGVTVLSTLVKAGKMRQAGKVRSYLRAAFSAAVRARLDAGAAPALRKLGIRHNPMADLPTLEGGMGGTSDRALSVAELRAYWQAIAGLPGVDGAILRLHLLTGAQRLAQIARVTVDDLDDDAGSITIRDRKGRRSQARKHVVPLIREAAADLEQLRGRGPYLFSVDGGRTGMGYWGFRHRLQAVVPTLLESDAVTAPFTAGDLRRTVETRLAGLGVPLEVRAHLQSHGLGGVQARHYDRHDYFEEKRAALERLHLLVSEEPASVTPIRRAKA